MTEAQWLAATDPAVMGEFLTPRPRATERVLRLFISAFWHWQSYRLKTPADQNRLRRRAALVGEWAESGSEPKEARESRVFVGFDENASEGFMRTVRAPGQWSDGRPAAAYAVWLLREIFGNPFATRRKRKTDPHRGWMFDPAWRTDTALTLARTMYNSREFSAMPILADALQDAGCDNDDILEHCRGLRESCPKGVVASRDTDDIPNRRNGMPRPDPASEIPIPTGDHVRGCWVVDLVLQKA